MLLDKAPQVGHSRAAAQNDLAPNVVSIFPLGWFNKSLPDKLVKAINTFKSQK